jgi:methionyl-tRNA formyltransferase
MTGRAAPPRRLVYFGTPAMAVPPLQALVAAGFDVVCVVTRVDKRRGRGGELMPSPVKAAAVELGLTVVHTVDDALGLVADLGADLGVVVAFGQLIKPHALAALPMVNLHFSLLPRWRGAAPVERAILEGDTVTGVCLMQLEEGLDTGPVHAVVEVPIASDATGDSLRARPGARSALELLCRRAHRRADRARAHKWASPRMRPSCRPTTCASTGATPASVRDRQIRLGGAWTTFRDKRFKVHAAEVVDPHATGDELAPDGTVGGIRLTRVQPEGKPAMPWRDFANGARPQLGERLT